MTRIAFVCPFNLDRLSGSPIRARTTIRAVEGVGELLVIDTGGSVQGAHAVVDAWQPRGGGHPRFRLDRFARGALRQLRAFQPDVVHAIGTPAVVPSVIYRNLRRSSRLVFEVHGLAKYEMQHASWLSRVLYSILDLVGVRASDAVVSMSHTQRDLLCKMFGLRPEKVHVLWGPIEMDKARYLQPAPAPPLNVGYLGNSAFWQGLDTVIRAAHLLSKERSIRFLLAGFDPEQYLQPDLRNIELAGSIPRSETWEFLARAHLLLSPRKGGIVSASQYPMKLSYYLAAGRPIIASDVNDQRRILREAECGLVFESGSADALARAVSDLTALSETRRVEMGLNARRFAERHLSITVFAKRLIDIYFG